MVLQALLLCCEPQLERTFRRALDDLGIAVDVATAADSALQRLAKNKFDAIIVDCDNVSGGTEVLAGIQKSASNKRAIAIALTNGGTTMRAAFEMGAHFALDKPVTLERAIRSLRAAQGFMMAEQRRYFRHPVDTTADLSFGTVKQLGCNVTNISDGGMAVVVDQQVTPGWAVDVRLTLPVTYEYVEARGEFAWSDGKGNAGIRFVYLPNDSKKSLTKWLTSQIDTADHAFMASGRPAAL